MYQCKKGTLLLRTLQYKRIFALFQLIKDNTLIAQQWVKLYTVFFRHFSLPPAHVNTLHLTDSSSHSPSITNSKQRP